MRWESLGSAGVGTGTRRHRHSSAHSFCLDLRRCRGGASEGVALSAADADLRQAEGAPGQRLAPLPGAVA
jgi:hypothetical protein